MSIKYEAECDVCGKREPMRTDERPPAYPVAWIQVDQPRGPRSQDAWMCSWGCAIGYSRDRQNEATA